MPGRKPTRPAPVKSTNDSSRPSAIACGNTRNTLVEQQTMKTSTRVMLITLMVGTVTMTGCAYNSSSPDVYTAGQAQREESVRFGTVESVRAVTISSNDGQPSGLGAIGGGALGAVAGSAFGGGRGSIATA